MASGDTLLEFFPQQNEPPAANFATVDLRNGHLVLDFDDTTAEYAIFKAIMPRNYSGGGLTAYVHYACTSATSGTAYWAIEFERIGDQQQDIDSDSFAGANQGNGSVPGTSGMIDVIPIAFSNSEIDGVLVGEAFRIRLSRSVDDDSISGDLELLGIEIKET